MRDRSLHRVNCTVTLLSSKLRIDGNAFDFTSIADVVLHLRYTARDGGEMLKTAARNAAAVSTADAAQSPPARLFSAKHEFPSEWHRFLGPQDPQASHVLALDLTRERFPFAFRSRSLTFDTMELFLKFKDGVSFQNGALLPLFVRRPETGAAVLTSALLDSGELFSDANQFAAASCCRDPTGRAGVREMASGDRARRSRPIAARLDTGRSGSNTAQPLNHLVDAIDDMYIVCRYAVGDMVV